jgi:hypothetical protein
MGKVKGFIINIDNLSDNGISTFFSSDKGRSFIQASKLLESFRVGIVSSYPEVESLMKTYNIKHNGVFQTIKEAARGIGLQGKEIIHFSGKTDHLQESKALSMDFIWIHGDNDSEQFSGDKMKEISYHSIDTTLSFLALMGR